LNILKLNYLVKIVENDFNITKAANELYISQPALSTSIIQMEKDIGFLIFNRYKGRLSHLTLDGKIIYAHAKKIIAEYDELIGIIELRSKNEEGEVTLGIPPLVITTLFTDFLYWIKEKNKRVKVSILEYGGQLLEEMLDEEKINFAVLVNTNKKNDERYHTLDIYLGEYGIFMSRNNPLSSKKKLNWQDLNGVSIAIVDKSYATYHIFESFIKEYNVKIHSMMPSYFWDYHFASVKNTHIMTFMPLITQEIVNMRGVKAILFEPPVPWKISFVWRKKSGYTSAASYLIDAFHAYFPKNEGPH